MALKRLTWWRQSVNRKLSKAEKIPILDNTNWLSISISLRKSPLTAKQWQQQKRKSRKKNTLTVWWFLTGFKPIPEISQSSFSFISRIFFSFSSGFANSNHYKFSMVAWTIWKLLEVTQANNYLLAWRIIFT